MKAPSHMNSGKAIAFSLDRRSRVFLKILPIPTRAAILWQSSRASLTKALFAPLTQNFFHLVGDAIASEIAVHAGH